MRDDPSAAAQRVKEAALACGFTHLRKFARDFAARFGETPSTVLGRPARPTRPRQEFAAAARERAAHFSIEHQAERLETTLDLAIAALVDHVEDAPLHREVVLGPAADGVIDERGAHRSSLSIRRSDTPTPRSSPARRSAAWKAPCW